MFKKITALFLVMSFTHVYAVTPVQESFSAANEINRSFDELNYRLNVEWDQKDSKYVKEAFADFEKNIMTLQAQGLSNKELTQYTLDKIKDKKTRDEVNEITKVINEKQMSSEEARDFAVSKLSKMYSLGTNWTGSRMHVPHVALILGIIALIYCCSKLHGKNGRDGKDGSNGKDGENGKDGHDGKDGENGQDGHDGQNCNNDFQHSFTSCQAS